MARQLARKRRAPVDPEDGYDEYEDDEEREEKRSRSRRRRPSWADEDDRDAEPARARRRSRDDEDEDDERPRDVRRRRQSSTAPEDDDTDERYARARRRSRRDEDDDDRPTRPSRGGGRRSSEDDERQSVSRGSGWDTLKDERAKKAAGSAHRLQVKDKAKIVHFLEEEPFAVYPQHWVGQRSYSCPGDCPLCDAGYDTRNLALFNLIDMKSGETLFWEAGPNAAKKILEAAEKKQSSPLNRDDLYFEITRTKQSNGFFDFTLTPIKERDLADDYDGTEPLTDEELEEALDNLFDDSVIPYTSKRDLRGVANGDSDE